MPRMETYHFVVVCPEAAAVFLLGEFNDWSTTATPMSMTEADVWQIDVELPAGQTRFSYFVIDQRWCTGRAPFGNTYLLPGTWANVFRTAAEAGIRNPSTVAARGNEGLGNVDDDNEQDGRAEFRSTRRRQCALPEALN